MWYVDEMNGQLFFSRDSRDCVVLECCLDTLFHTDGDFERVHWEDGQGYYDGRLVVTALSDGEDE